MNGPIAASLRAHAYTWRGIKHDADAMACDEICGLGMVWARWQYIIYMHIPTAAPSTTAYSAPLRLTSLVKAGACNASLWHADARMQVQGQREAHRPICPLALPSLLPVLRATLSGAVFSSLFRVLYLCVPNQLPSASSEKWNSVVRVHTQQSGFMQVAAVCRVRFHAT